MKCWVVADQSAAFSTAGPGSSWTLRKYCPLILVSLLKLYTTLQSFSTQDITNVVQSEGYNIINNDVFVTSKFCKTDFWYNILSLMQCVKFWVWIRWWCCIFCISTCSTAPVFSTLIGSVLVWVKTLRYFAPGSLSVCCSHEAWWIHELNMGINALLQVTVSVYNCVCHGRCGLRLRRRDGVRVFIFQNNLFMFCRSLTFSQIRFLLNDGVETDSIFEVFSQSVFLHRKGGNSRFGFEMADKSCTNT